MKKNVPLSKFLLLLILVMFFAVFIIPMIYGIIISFTNWNGLTKDFEFVWFDNYAQMFRDTRFLDSMIVTIKYMLILLVATIILGYISAKSIQQIRRFKSGVLFVSFFPYVVTPVIACILWNQIYIGMLPEFGDFTGIEFLQKNLLADKSSALYAVAFVDLWILIPYAMILFSSAINSIPEEILEYAKVEGASAWQITRHIELPYIVSTIGIITTVAVSYAFTHIDTLMTLTSGGPGRVTETVYYTIYKNSTLEQKYAYGLAEGIIVAIISVAIFLVINRMTNSGNLDYIDADTTEG